MQYSAYTPRNIIKCIQLNVILVIIIYTVWLTKHDHLYIFFNNVVIENVFYTI